MAGDGEFESVSLQRGVTCEPDWSRRHHHTDVIITRAPKAVTFTPIPLADSSGTPIGKMEVAVTIASGRHGRPELQHPAPDGFGGDVEPALGE